MRTEDIAIDKVKVLENIRQKPLQDDLIELMESIKQNGLLQPIGVKEAKKGYLLIWGYRRLIACKKLGHKTIPAIISRGKDDDLFEEDFLVLNATENIQRKDVNMVELGRICFILKKKKLSNYEIAIRLSIPKSRVESALDSFTRVPERHRDKITLFSSGERRKRAGKIGATISGAITRMRGVNASDRDKIFDFAKEEDVNTAQIKVLNNLIREDMPIEKAFKEVKKYKSLTLKFVVKQENFDKYIKQENNIKGFFKRIINKAYPNLIY